MCKNRKYGFRIISAIAFPWFTRNIFHLAHSSNHWKNCNTTFWWIKAKHSLRVHLYLSESKGDITSRWVHIESNLMFYWTATKIKEKIRFRSSLSVNKPLPGVPDWASCSAFLTVGTMSRMWFIVAVYLHRGLNKHIWSMSCKAPRPWTIKQQNSAKVDK